MKLKSLTLVSFALAAFGLICCSCSGGADSTTTSTTPSKVGASGVEAVGNKPSGGGAAPNKAMMAPPGVQTGSK